MAHRHGEYRSEQHRDEARHGSRRGSRPEEREGSERSRWDEDDSPEVLGFGRNMSDEYRRQSREWDAERDERDSQRWSPAGGEIGSYDEGRVLYGQRGGAQRGREYGDREYEGSEWDRGRRRGGAYAEGSGRAGWGQGYAQSGGGFANLRGSQGEYGQGSSGGPMQGAYRERERESYGEGRYAGRGQYGGHGQREQGEREQGQYAGRGEYERGRWPGQEQFGMGGSQPGEYQGGRWQPARRFSYRGIGPKGYERSDERLREIICEMLTDDEDIDASNIEILVSDHEVTLTGTVSDRRTKYQVEDMIGNLAGVRDVSNQLRVSSQPGTVGAQQAQPTGATTDSGTSSGGSGQSSSSQEESSSRPGNRLGKKG